MRAAQVRQRRGREQPQRRRAGLPPPLPALPARRPPIPLPVGLSHAGASPGRALGGPAAACAFGPQGQREAERRRAEEREVCERLPFFFSRVICKWMALPYGVSKRSRCRVALGRPTACGGAPGGGSRKDWEPQQESHQQDATSEAPKRTSPPPVLLTYRALQTREHERETVCAQAMHLCTCAPSVLVQSGASEAGSAQQL